MFWATVRPSQPPTVPIADWLDPGLRRGDEEVPPLRISGTRQSGRQLGLILDRAAAGEALGEADIVQLFAARGVGFEAVCEVADDLRRRVNGDVVSYVVTRNINYTNICYFRCQFCAFSKGKLSENLRGRPYDLDLSEIQRRVEEAWARGAAEVCLQGGIHPEYTGATYLAICRAIKEAVPGMHIHAFSPLEIWQGAKTVGAHRPGFLARTEGGRPQLLTRHGGRGPR